MILLEDLVEEFGVDVVRWFFSDKALGTHMEFDTALAGEQSEKNPVYYVQYAHARIASVLARTRGLKADRGFLACGCFDGPDGARWRLRCCNSRKS